MLKWSNRCKAVVAHLLTALAISGGIFLVMPEAVGHEAPCSPIDIRDHLSPELQNFLRFPKDQSGFGNCFAHATATLLSVKLGVPVSAIDLTIASFYETKNQLPKDNDKEGILNGGPGGDPSDTLKVMLGKSVCREADMPSIDDFLDGQDSRTLESLQQLHKTIMDLKADSESQDQGERHCKLEIGRYFPNLDNTTLYEILRETDQNAMIETLHRLADADCSGRRISIPSDLKVKYLDRKTARARMISAIDAQLQKNAPVAFSFKAGTRITDLADHEMAILGREMKNGQCTYIVRNSWGYGCDGLPEMFRINCNPIDGTYRLPRELLRREIGDIGYIE